MKVLTYNLHKGCDRRGRPMLESALDALADQRPDILLCQEVFRGRPRRSHRSHNRGAFEDQCARIAEALDMPHYVFGPNAFYRRGCHGNAVFSRDAKVRNSRNIDATESRLEKRGILHVELAKPGHAPLHVYSVHFSLTGRQRRKQWDRLLAALPQLLSPSSATDSAQTQHVLVGGDFNDWRSRLDVDARRHAATIEGALWKLDKAERRTFPAHRPTFALDRIYTRGLTLRDVEVLSGSPWSRLSDHLPVMARFEGPLDAEAEPPTRR